MDQGTVVCRMCGCEMVERSRYDICHWCGMAMVEGSEERALAEAGLLSEPEEAQWERAERLDPVQAWLDSQARERARSLALEIAQEQAPALSTEAERLARWAAWQKQRAQEYADWLRAQEDEREAELAEVAFALEEEALELDHELSERGLDARR